MPAKRFNEADIDFDAMDGELAKLVPPKLSLADVLDRLRKRLIEQQAKGVTVAQMHEVLKSGGIDITERSLRTFLDKGVLPGRKVAEAARTGARWYCRRRSESPGSAIVVFPAWLLPAGVTRPGSPA